MKKILCAILMTTILTSSVNVLGHTSEEDPTTGDYATGGGVVLSAAGTVKSLTGSTKTSEGGGGSGTSASGSSNGGTTYDPSARKDVPDVGGTGYNKSPEVTVDQKSNGASGYDSTVRDSGDSGASASASSNGSGTGTSGNSAKTGTDSSGNKSTSGSNRSNKTNQKKTNASQDIASVCNAGVQKQCASFSTAGISTDAAAENASVWCSANGGSPISYFGTLVRPGFFAWCRTPKPKGGAPACELLIPVIKQNICKCVSDVLKKMPPVHEDWWSFKVFDVWGAVGRAINAAVKYFLSDDNDLVAELVFDDDGSCDTGSGGCGGVYDGAGSGCSTDLVLNAVASSLTDIPAESDAYPADISIKDTAITELAKFRMQDVVKDRAALDQLSNEQWAVRYRAQRRAIQALTDALVMKKAYSELSALANSLSAVDFSDYGNAASTVATRRLMLDALMALRKRVIAARVRARAELMEMNIESIAEEASLPQATEPTTGTGTGTGTGTEETGTTSGTTTPPTVGSDQQLSDESGDQGSGASGSDSSSNDEGSTPSNDNAD